MSSCGVLNAPPHRITSRAGSTAGLCSSSHFVSIGSRGRVGLVHVFAAQAPDADRPELASSRPPTVAGRSSSNSMPVTNTPVSRCRRLPCCGSPFDAEQPRCAGRTARPSGVIAHGMRASPSPPRRIVRQWFGSRSGNARPVSDRPEQLADGSRRPPAGPRHAAPRTTRAAAVAEQEARGRPGWCRATRGCRAGRPPTRCSARRTCGRGR